MLDVLARMALPVNDTRGAIVVRFVAERETTLRDVPAARVVAARDALPDVAALPRETTLRDVTAVRDAFVAVGRDTVLVLALPRDTTVRDVAVVRAALDGRDDTPRADVAVVLATVELDAFARVVVRPVARAVVPARGDCGPFAVTTGTGAIGSANTARIDNNVEQTKNAPANRNTVPTAFLQNSTRLRFLINLLPVFRDARKPTTFGTQKHTASRPVCYNYNILCGVCKDHKQP